MTDYEVTYTREEERENGDILYLPTTETVKNVESITDDGHFVILTVGNGAEYRYTLNRVINIIPS